MVKCMHTFKKNSKLINRIWFKLMMGIPDSLFGISHCGTYYREYAMGKYPSENILGKMALETFGGRKILREHDKAYMLKGKYTWENNFEQ